MALISTSQLADRLNDPKLRILDARWYLDPNRKGIEAYSAGHIPGAFFADLEHDFAGPGGKRGGLLGRHPFPSPAKVQNVIRLYGITPGVRVVAYDDAAGAIAARVWFVLKANGFDDCDVLDGGITKWISEGREITQQPPSISTMTDFVVAPRPELVLSKATFIAAKDRALVLDARVPERYRGETEPIDPRAGHVPGALNAPYTFNLTPGPNPVLKPATELRAQFEALGVSADNEPIVYCGSGINAAHDLLALEVAGFKGRLYGGSWSEWSSDPDLPVRSARSPQPQARIAGETNGGIVKENPVATAPKLEAKHLYRRLDALFRSIEKARTPRRLVEAFLDGLFRELAEPLKFRSASLYMERPSGFRLSKQLGETIRGAFDTLSADEEPLSLVLQHRVYLHTDAAGMVAAKPYGVAPAFAACVVGRRPRRYVYVFALGDGFQAEEIDFTLNTLRASLSSRLMEERLQGGLREAAEIQASLLPDMAPSFPPFEMAQKSHPAEEVGGDFFDYRQVATEDVLGVAIGDASGHGLPAALLVRDVVIGLRMGLEKDLRITSVFQRLNRVIHESTLSSKFISVFYAELEKDGTLSYVNAGHPAPILISRDAVERLNIGGTVIGPLPEVRFKRGLATLSAEECLVMCTDGILERRGPGDEFYGEQRLIETVRRNMAKPAQDILNAVFKECETFGSNRPFDDDATLVVIRHAAPSA